MQFIKKKPFKVLILLIIVLSVIKLYINVELFLTNKKHIFLKNLWAKKLTLPFLHKNNSAKKSKPDLLMLTKVAVAAESEETPNYSNDLSIDSEWKRLKIKELELSKKEKALKELEKKINEKILYEKNLKKKLEDLIKKVELIKSKKIKHLVSVYSNMEPQQAAKVLEKLDVNLAVKILAGMRGRKAGEILSYMEANKAAQLSKALTEFQTPFGP